MACCSNIQVATPNVRQQWRGSSPTLLHKLELAKLMPWLWSVQQMKQYVTGLLDALTKAFKDLKTRRDKDLDAVSDGVAMGQSHLREVRTVLARLGTLTQKVLGDQVLWKSQWSNRIADETNVLDVMATDFNHELAAIRSIFTVKGKDLREDYSSAMHGAIKQMEREQILQRDELVEKMNDGHKFWHPHIEAVEKRQNWSNNLLNNFSNIYAPHLLFDVIAPRTNAAMSKALKYGGMIHKVYEELGENVTAPIASMWDNYLRQKQREVLDLVASQKTERQEKMSNVTNSVERKWRTWSSTSTRSGRPCALSGGTRSG